MIEFPIKTIFFLLAIALNAYADCPKEMGDIEDNELVKIDTIRLKIIVERCIDKCEGEGKCRNSLIKPDTIIETNITTTKFIKTDSTDERIYIISDTLGNIKQSWHRINKDNNLVRLIFNGVTLDIIHSPDPCVFKIIESAHNTISFQLDPKKEFYDFINNISALATSVIKLKHKHFIDTSYVYQEAIDSKYYDCKLRHGEDGR